MIVTAELIEFIEFLVKASQPYTRYGMWCYRVDSEECLISLN